jgi:large subunit ribosomal protein L4
VRALALKTALSAKAQEGQLIVVDSLTTNSHKTSEMRKKLAALGVRSAIFIGGEEVDGTFALAVRNLPYMDVLPSQGANVYDILRHEVLVLSKDAVEKLEARLS